MSQTNNEFSHLNNELIEILKNDKFLQKKSINFQADNILPFMHDYNYVVSPWPVIIDKGLKNQFQQFISVLPALMYKAIRIFFEKDVEMFVEYLNEPSMLLDLIHKQKYIKPKEMFIRYDLLFSSGQMKIVEANAGSNIGGWELDWLIPQFNEILMSNEKTASLKVSHKGITESFFSAIFDLIAEQDEGDIIDGHVLMFDNNPKQQFGFNGDFGNHIQSFFNQKKPKDQQATKLLYFNDFEKIKFSHDGSISFEEQKIAIIIIPITEQTFIPKHIYFRLIASCMAEKVIFTDSPMHTIIGHKMVFALLHEQKVLDQLSEEERLMIKLYIPWSRKLSDQLVNYDEKEQAFDKILYKNKDAFVIKKAKSLQGKDVHVGKFHNAEKWRILIEKLMSEKDWLVQEYCAPDQFYGCHPENGLQLQHMIYGVFDFGSKYGGTFVRGTHEDRNGVINSSSGATEFVVYET